MSPRIGPVHWKVLECVFLRVGFQFERQRGDHRVYTRPDCLRPIVIPTYNEIDPDIILSNMRTAGMGRDEYFRLLRDC